MTARPRGVTAEDAVIRIRPRRPWLSLELRELWSYRELGYYFVWRDLKVRYKQTVFGALWAVIQPDDALHPGLPRMPLAAQPLTANQIQNIVNWITDGAPDN